MKRLLAFCLICLLALPGLARAEDVDVAALDEAIRWAFAKRGATGGVVLVAVGGEICYEYAYGMAHLRDRTPMTMDHCFRIASVTKLVSAIHVMQLVEQGKLALDAPIGDVLGYPVRNPKYPQADITLRMLMTHTSSITNTDGYIWNGWNLRELLATGKDGARADISYERYAPGTQYLYSNFGAGVMGSLIEAATGKNLNDSVTEGLFAPLGVNAAYHVSLLNDVAMATD